VVRPRKRCFLLEGNLNYHDLILVRNKPGNISAVDMHVFISGEKLSETIRRNYLMIAASWSRTFLDKLTGKESEFGLNLPVYMKIVECLREERFPELLEHIAELPPSLREDKSIMLIAINAASNCGPERYKLAVEDFRRVHPKDPSMNLMSIDHYYLKGRYDQALNSIDWLESLLGGDPYLHVLRAGLFMEQGKIELARKSLLLAIEEDPTLENAYWTMVTLTLKEKNHAESAKWLTVIGDTLGIEFVDLTEIPEYQDFVKSSEYTDWLSSQREK